MEREEENGRGPAVNMINFRFSSEKPAAPWEIISRRIYTAFLPIFPRSKYVWSNRMLVTNGRYRRRRSTTADFTNFPSLPVFFNELSTLPCVIALYIFHFALGIIWGEKIECFGSGCWTWEIFFWTGYFFFGEIYDIVRRIILFYFFPPFCFRCYFLKLTSFW